MHELGVVFHIADTLARIAEENQVTRIRRVTLELGEVSTVVPEYLIDVWNWNCKRTPLLTGCELVIERIPAVTHCGACGRDYPTVPQGKICPPLRQPPRPGSSRATNSPSKRSRFRIHKHTPAGFLGETGGGFMRDSDYHGALVAQTSS